MQIIQARRVTTTNSHVPTERLSQDVVHPYYGGLTSVLEDMSTFLAVKWRPVTGQLHSLLKKLERVTNNAIGIPQKQTAEIQEWSME
ncbi:hypothetical protein BGW37DRAFT_522282 [Umbelopsis sp. PMI_123]|nr:hypothetical protein BGW37DRAFT_522282 [Umbelopsis sp. PMI_123]